MIRPDNLADRAALERNRARARQNPAFFLIEAAADDVHERLNEVNRTFTKPAVVSAFAEIWSKNPPGAAMVKDRPVLEFPATDHDLIIHVMSLHWADDPVGQLIQCRRALAPDGMLVAVLFGGQTLQELRIALAEAEIALSDGLSPRIAPMAEIRDLGALLQRAGFALPVADSMQIRVTYATLHDLMRDLRAMGEANALAQRSRSPAPRQLFDRAEEIYRDRFADPDGRLPATFEIITLTGWAPDEGQPTALRPGSAKSRLAEALGTTEVPLSDKALPKRN